VSSNEHGSNVAEISTYKQKRAQAYSATLGDSSPTASLVTAGYPHATEHLTRFPRLYLDLFNIQTAA
jgi:hypothetical protein